MSSFLKKFCSETNRSSGFAWLDTGAVRPKTAADLKDLPSLLKHFRTLPTPITRTFVNGSGILPLNLSPKKQLTAGCVVGSTETGRNQGAVLDEIRP